MSLLDERVRIRVSSVLNRDIKQYGKKFLTDGSDETCWNSDAGVPQHITIDFGRAVVVESLKLMFQVHEAFLFLPSPTDLVLPAPFVGGLCWPIVYTLGEQEQRGGVPRRSRTDHSPGGHQRITTLSFASPHHPDLPS